MEVTNGQVAEAIDNVIAHRRVDPRWTFYGPGRWIPSEDPVLSRELYHNLKKYRDVERDAKVSGALEKLNDIVVSAEVQITPGRRIGRSVTREDRRVADICREVLSHMGSADDPAQAKAKFPSDFAGLQYGLLDGLLMGFASGEVIWNTDTNTTFVEGVRMRDQERFVFDIDENLRLKTVDKPFDGRTLPPRKFLTPVFGSQWDPWGKGLGHSLYHLVWFKREGLKFWLRFLDKFGAPTVIGYYPGGTKATGRGSVDTLKDAINAIQSNSAVVIPENMKVELLQAITTAAQQGYDQFEKYIDNQISQAILGVTLTTDIGSVGSRAAEEGHRKDQGSKAVKVGNALMSFLRCTLLTWITRFNSATGAVPEMRKIFSDYNGLAALATVDNQLWQTGYIRKLESVNRIYGHGEDVYEKAPEPAPPVAPAPAEEPVPEQSEDKA